MGTISACGREATPLGLADAQAGDAVRIQIDGIGAIENRFE